MGIGWLTIEQLVARTASAGIFVLLARTLGPRELGVAIYALTVVGFVQLFLSQGLQEAIVQSEEISELSISSVFWTLVSLGGVATFFVVMFANEIAVILREPTMARYIRGASAGLLITSLSVVPMALLQRVGSYRYLAIRGMLSVIGGGAVALVIAYSGGGAWALVGQFVLSGVVSTLVVWRAARFRPAFEYSMLATRRMLAYAWRVFALGLGRTLRSRLDDLLIGALLGPTVLGIYSVGYRAVEVLEQLTTRVVSRVAFPTFAAAHQSAAGADSAVRRSLASCAFYGWPMFFGLAALSPTFVPVVFGPDWSLAAPVMGALSMLGFTTMIGWVSLDSLAASGRPGRAALIQAAALVGTVGVLVSVHQHGIVWLSSALAIVGFMWLPLALMPLADVLPGVVATMRSEQSHRVMMFAVITAAVTVVVQLKWPGSSAVELGLVSLIAGVLFVSLVRVLAPKAYSRVKHDLRSAIQAISVSFRQTESLNR